MLAIAKNSYVTVEEADEIVRLLFRPYDEFRVYWSVLSAEEKEGYLLRTTQQMDALVYSGKKHHQNQSLQFPRNHNDSVPETVKHAAVYNALGLMNEDLKASAEKQMRAFKSLGVFKNPRLDQTSMRAIATAENATPTEVKVPLASRTAYELLRPYRCGAFSIR